MPQPWPSVAKRVCRSRASGIPLRVAAVRIIRADRPATRIYVATGGAGLMRSETIACIWTTGEEARRRGVGRTGAIPLPEAAVGVVEANRVAAIDVITTGGGIRHRARA